MKQNSSYRQLSPSILLKDYVDSYWESKNLTDQPLERTIFPDSFFKLIINFVEGKITTQFLTGIWTKEKEITIQAKSTVYGIKFKMLAPEYIFNREIGRLIESVEFMASNFWNINEFKFHNLNTFVKQIEPVILQQLQINEDVDSRKLALSKLLDTSNGNILVREISEQINWSSRQMNRYFTNYLGLSLKSYLNIQKIYAAYISVVLKKPPPEGFHDQSHFIREIKKHTHHTPTELENQINDRFIQLKNIQKR